MLFDRGITICCLPALHKSHYQMSTSPTPAYTHAADVDYSDSMRNVTTVILVLATVTLLAQIYARRVAQKVQFGFDDALLYIAWTGLVGNCAGNYLVAEGHLVSNVPGTAAQTEKGLLGIRIDSGFYPYGIVAGKLSLLFLIRRIFNTNGKVNKWFTIGWYFTFFLVFPIWFVLVYTWTGLSQHNKISEAFEDKYVIPLDSILTLITDLCILSLPVGMVSKLQLTWTRKLSIMAIFALGSIGSIVSLLRVIFSYISVSQNWDPRYSLYVEGLLGLAEVGIVVICACLPATRPLFIKIQQFSSKTFSNFSNMSTTLKSGSRSRPSRSTAISLGSQGYNDDEPMRLDQIHQQKEYNVAIEDADSHDSAEYQHAHLDGKSRATVTTHGV